MRSNPVYGELYFRPAQANVEKIESHKSDPRPAAKRIERLAERVAGLGWSACGQLEVEEELVQSGEFVNLLQDALHRPVRLRADTLTEDGADLESGLGLV